MRDVPQLRHVREGLALSQRDLAAKSGVAHDTIGQLERGERKARPSTIRKLAQALGVEPTALLEESQASSTPDNEAFYIQAAKQAFQESFNRTASLLDQASRQGQQSKNLAEARMQAETGQRPPSDEVSLKSQTWVQRRRERMRRWQEWYDLGKSNMEWYVAGHSEWDEYLTGALGATLGEDLAIVRLKLKSDDLEEVEEAALIAARTVRKLIKSLSESLEEILAEYGTLPDRYYEDPSSARRIGEVGKSLAAYWLRGIETVQKWLSVHDEALRKLGDERSPRVGVVELRKEEAE